MTTVAITGLGVVSGAGLGADAFWEALVAGREIRRVPHFEARDFVRSAQGRRIDRTSLLALAACRLALDDARIGPVAGGGTGLVLGSALGNLVETSSFLDRLLARGTGNPLVFPNLVMNAPLAYASIELGITGWTTMVTEHEATGEVAIATAAELIMDGTVGSCLAGGADESAAVLDEVLRESRAAARDARSRGVLVGEGAAVLVLEALDAARARGARVYATIRPSRGFSVASPVYGWPADPAALGAELAPLVAEVDAIVAATRGPRGASALETAALARACMGRRPTVFVPRAATGEFGAAGALATAAAARALAEGVIPPSVVEHPDPSLDIVVGRPRRQPLRSIVVNGMARGGACRPLRLEACG